MGEGKNQFFAIFCGVFYSFFKIKILSLIIYNVIKLYYNNKICN